MNKCFECLKLWSKLDLLFCFCHLHSPPSITLLPMTPASPHVVETSLNSTFDDGLCVTVDVGLLFFLHDVVQTYIKENETSSSGERQIAALFTNTKE